MVLDLEQLLRRRNALRTRSNNAVDAATTILDDETLHDVAVLVGQSDILVGIQHSLQELDGLILDHLQDAQIIETETIESGQAQDLLILTIVRLRTLGSTLERRNTHDEEDRRSQQSQQNAPVQQGPTQGRTHAKLPMLTLPNFSGDPLQWSSFWDSYESSIHGQPSLSAVEKFSYLRSLLKGSAFDSISGIAVTNANYDTAIKLIRQRFGQRQAIINAHVETLVNLPRAPDDTTKLRSLYDSTEIHIRGLETQGLTSVENTLLTPILLTKLPDEIRLIITRKNNGPIGDLDLLRDLFRTEIEVRELSSMTSKKLPPRPEKEHQRVFTAGALVNPGVPPAHCGFCKSSGHGPFTCPTYTTPESRRQQVFANKLCLNCLKCGHPADRCLLKGRCQRCHRRHHTTVCNQTERGATSPDKSVNSKNSPAYVVVEDSENTQVTVNPSQVLVSNSTAIYMQTARAAVQDFSGKRHVIRMLFDTGSHRSYITSSLASKLSLPSSRSEVLKFASFGGHCVQPKPYKVVDIKCSSVSGNTTHHLSTVVVPQITCPIYRAPLLSDVPAFKHLSLADPPSSHHQWLDIDVLVGLDYYWQLVNDQVIRFPEQGLTAVSSVFGWLVSGSSSASPDTEQQAAVLYSAVLSMPSDNFLTKFWETESLEEPYSSAHATQGDAVLERFEDTIRFKEGRYEVSLPWKEDATNLPTNYGLSRRRFNSLVNRLHREDVLQQYADVITQQAKLGFIEPVEDASESSGLIHYIPHHPVIKTDHTTTKLRIVYDASAQQSAGDPSLNDSLYSGPNLVSELTVLLLKFRSFQIVILADIEKAFLQVGLRSEDRDSTRFFWLKDLSKPPTDDNLQIWRFCRVPFGATSSPFLLAATLRYHLDNSSSEAAAKMVGHFYVDNLISEATTTEEAVEFYQDAKEVMRSAGMNLREWTCNIPEVMDAIPDIDRAKDTDVKVLGLPWNIPDDVIRTKGAPMMTDDLKPTKRQILQTIAKVFDPLGLLAPVVIPAKVFIQSLWKQQTGWDEHPPEAMATQWKHLNQQLATVDKITIPRRVVINDSSDLHVFADASGKAYAAVAYVRTSVNGSVKTQLVFSKSRVSPIKTISTPRLELLAAGLGCKVAALLTKTFPSIKSVQLWSDSQVVLHWIHNCPSKQGMFVSNRVREIQSYKFPFQYCNTSDNPADLPSRGKDTVDLGMSSLWWSGPVWLKESEDNWPASPISAISTVPPPTQLEAVAVVALVPALDPDPPFGIEESNFSSLLKLLRVTAYCSRFITKLQRNGTPIGPITSEELAIARIKWIKHVQQQHFTQQLTHLKTGRHDPLVRQLRLFFDDDGILKCHGRFQKANVHNTNDVALLPKNSHFTNLTILHYHNNLFHQGVRHTLAIVRQSYWFPQGRQQVRYVLNRCTICKRWEGSAFSLPNPPALPSERVAKGPPFSFTGCDFAGPVFTFSATEPQKAYICLFTCAVTRAVHLELVRDMTTDCFLMALKRFIPRRGTPVQIISDNAKTFKLAQSTISRIWHSFVINPGTANYIASKGIQWKYNVQRAPWWGGFFERMVGLTKRTIIKAVGKAKLSYDAMVTLLTEVEAILNTRPLTYVYDDLSNGLPLSPANFLSETTNYGLPTPDALDDPDFKCQQQSAVDLVQRFRKRQRIVDRFWHTWSTEYLATLREHHHHVKLTKRNPYCPHVGDVVLVKEDNVKRAEWKIAVVVYLYSNKDDGQVRAAQLRCNEKLIQRPISRLFPLEVQAVTDDVLPKTPEIPEKYHGRKAAQKALKNIQNILADN